MKFARTLIVAALPLALAVGCETQQMESGSMQDKAMTDKVDMANKNAAAAQSAAERAAEAANRSAASAAAAARAAERAAAEAKAAGDKADRAFRRGMRK